MAKAEKAFGWVVKLTEAWNGKVQHNIEQMSTRLGMLVGLELCRMGAMRLDEEDN